MNLLHLEYFRALANIQHVQKTGEYLHVSPSAISAGIRSLEQELGVQLFNRVGRSMKLNDCGKVFLPYVEDVFSSLQKGVSAVQAAQCQQQKRVSFTITDAALYIDLVSRFSKEHPDIIIRQLNRSPDRHGKLIDQADLDFIMTSQEIENCALDSCVLFEEQIIVAVPPTHPLASAKPPRSIFEFQDDIFLMRAKPDYFQQYVDWMLNEIGFHPTYAMEMDSILRYRMFQRGGYTLITTKRSQENEIPDSSVAIPIREFAPFSLTKKLYWKKDVPLSPGALRFKSFLLDIFSPEKDPYL